MKQYTDLSLDDTGAADLRACFDELRAVLRKHNVVGALALCSGDGKLSGQLLHLDTPDGIMVQLDGHCRFDPEFTDAVKARDRAIVGKFLRRFDTTRKHTEILRDNLTFTLDKVIDVHTRANTATNQLVELAAGAIISAVMTATGDSNERG